MCYIYAYGHRWTHKRGSRGMCTVSTRQVRCNLRLIMKAWMDAKMKWRQLCEVVWNDVARARASSATRPIDVLTECFHFLWRHWIRGVSTVVWYGLPQNAHFFPELLNMSKEMAEAGSTVQSLAICDTLNASHSSASCVPRGAST